MKKNQHKSLPKLEDVLAYELPDLIHRFRDDWDLPYEEVEAIFTETKKFLWLMCAHYHDRKAGLTPPNIQFTASTYMLDTMWHQFILYTPEYEKFTYDFFGYFMGHAPAPRDMIAEYEKEKAAHPERVRRENEEQLQQQYAYVREKLGEETYRIWYIDWAEKYQASHLNTIRKPIELKSY